MNKKVIITGGMGYVGSNLWRYLEGKGYEIYIVGYKRDIAYGVNNKYIYYADITDYSQICKLVSAINPDIIIHTAAISSLIECEEKKDLAFAINVIGTRNIIKSIKDMRDHPKLIFFSSDYVFKGDQGNYRENDPVDPQTFYGKTKAISENEIKNKLDDFVICRSANLYGNGGKFFSFLCDELLNAHKIDVFNNTYYTPTYIGYLLNSVQKLIEKDFIGTIHICGNERVTRYEFAIKLAEALGVNNSFIRPIKQPLGGLISSDSSLNSDFAQNYLDIFLPTIDKSIYYSLGYLLNPYFYFKDDRGKIIGINNDQRWEEINYIESTKGSIRGNHYHKETLEGFYIIEGKIKVTLINLIGKTRKEFIVAKGDIFLIAPNIIHIFQILADSKWINMLSKKMDQQPKDIYYINCIDL